jgi:hypothetical protein
MLLTLAIAFLAALGYLLDYFLDKQKHKKARKWIAVFCVTLSLLVIAWNHVQREREIKDWKDKFGSAQTGLNEIMAQNGRLLSQNDSLQVQIRGVRERLQPFMDIATRNYPGLNEDQALAKLVTHISDISRTLEHMQPKLIFLTDKTKSWKDNNGLFHARYFFDSQYSIPLKDISIEMKFDGPVILVEGKIVDGAVVMDEGSRTVIDNDRKGFKFVTGLLIVGNEIMIEVISKDQLNIMWKRLLPD